MLNNGTLIIRSMHRARDNGKYVCKVKDNNGSSQNGIVQVQVMGNNYNNTFTLHTHLM